MSHTTLHYLQGIFCHCSTLFLSGLLLLFTYNLKLISDCYGNTDAIHGNQKQTQLQFMIISQREYLRISTKDQRQEPQNQFQLSTQNHKQEKEQKNPEKNKKHKKENRNEPSEKTHRKIIIKSF